MIIQGNVIDPKTKSKVMGNTATQAVADIGRSNRKLSLSLMEMTEKQCLGYPDFSAQQSYAAGDKVFYDRRLYKFKSAHAAGAWNASHVDLWGVREELIEILAALDNKASITGYYESMGVGTAKRLENEEPVTDSFLVRTAGGDAEIANGLVKLEEIGGRSVKFNQLDQTGNSSYSKWSGTWGTRSVANNIATFSLTTTGSNANAARLEATQTDHIIASHKYYLSAYLKPSKDTNGRFYITSFSDYVVLPANVWTKMTCVLDVGNKKIELGVYCNARGELNVNDTVQYKQIMTIDLTAMGIDNLTTVEEVEAYLKENFGEQEYYDYDAGSVVNVNMTGIEATNRNLLDENGNAELIANYDASGTYDSYYGITGTHGTIVFTDKQGNASIITPDYEGKFLIENDGTINVMNKGADCAVFLWWDGTKTDFVEHEVNVGRVDVPCIYGKKNGTGELVPVFPDGACGIGDVKDLLTIEGGEAVVKKLYGKVDLGDLIGWSYDSTYGRLDYNTALQNAKKPSTQTTVPNIISSKYSPYNSNNIIYNDNAISLNTNGYVRIMDSSIQSTDISNGIISKLSGISLIYELETPITYTDLVYMGSEYFEDGTPVTLPVVYNADNWGIEAILPKNTSTILTTKPTITAKYALDAIETINTLNDRIDMLQETKASKNGYHEEMGVGTATNLKGDMPSEGMPFTFRKSGGSNEVATGTAYMEKVEGNTVNYNQLVSAMTNNPAQNIGLTATINENGGLSISGTPSSIPPYGQLYILQSVKFKRDGRAYYIRFNHKPNANWGVSGYGILQTKNYMFFQQTDTGEWNGSIAIKVEIGVPVDESNLIVSIFDLRQMFGASDADIVAALGLTDASEITTDAGAAAFEKYLENTLGKKEYYPYSEGELIPVNMTALETIGFNQWDEEWEIGSFNFTTGELISNSQSLIRSKNYIPVIPSTVYCFKNITGGFNLLYYDRSKNYIDKQFNVATSSSQLITIPDNCYYIKFRLETSYGATYNNDICINLSDSAKNGTYEPYWKNTLAFDPKNVYGQLEGEGELVQCFPDGMKRAGSANDVVDLNNASADVKIKSQNLGGENVNWSFNNEEASVHVFKAEFNAIKAFNKDIKANIICDSYSATSRTSMINDDGLNKTISAGGLNGTEHRINLHDNSYSTTQSLKESLSGVYIFYELAAPLHYTNCIYRDPVSGQDIPLKDLQGYKIDNNGTEKILPENTTEIVTCSPSLNIRYGVNAVGAIRSLPTSYVGVSGQQSFTSEQKTRARTNIGAVSFDDVKAIGSSLPTSDPETAGLLWNDNGVVKVSAGSSSSSSE